MVTNYALAMLFIKSFARNPYGWWWLRLMLALPLWYRQRVADNGRKESKAKQQNLKPDIMDVTSEEVVKVMEMGRAALWPHTQTQHS